MSMPSTRPLACTRTRLHACRLWHWHWHWHWGWCAALFTLGCWAQGPVPIPMPVHAALPVSSPESAPGDASALSVREVQAGVFVHLGILEDWAPGNGGDVANLAFVVGSRCVAVIDTGGTPSVGRAWAATVQHRTALPVCYVITTHAHPDHMLGNAAFAQGLRQPQRPQFVASARFASMLAAREPYYRAALQRDFGIHMGPADIIYPDLTVVGSLQLDLGGRMLTLQAWPSAHTDSDMTVLDAPTRTLIAGDLLFVQHLPTLDGNLQGWLCALKSLRGLKVDMVVPGHGPVSPGWPGVLDAERGYLQALLKDTRAALLQGLSLQQAVDRIAVAPGAPWLLVDQFHRGNVTAAYAELEWEEETRPCSS